eukprot:gnl/MRDRNA2_/MRDRNA2_155484_c0_seq1.p1 gnl/MRDRNA2_/MRDRNA2_155484_c0~~gnl/MRDRNA2_/MRDRNA2_155484_c0_seq1.p1  ORF type:complete len:328 (-),score=44.59 gnl/MRDRNA2_/MRDRNA2_155484_c0_seq1:304-1197(-)
MESEDTSRAVRLLIATAYPLNVEENDGEGSLSPPSTSRSQYGSTDEDCCSLLTIGVSKALGSSMLAVQQRGCKVLLELGMGTGRVALQSFLECSCLEKVVGVEIQGGRFAAAEKAIGRLAKANPARFYVECSSASHGFQSIVLYDGKRRLEMWCRDVLTIPAEEIRAADAIVAQMSPESSRKHCDMQALLNNAKDGCRLLSGKDLSTVWQLDAACCWHVCQPENKETVEDRPWIPGGYKTFLFEARSSMPPSIFKSKNSESSDGSGRSEGSIQCILLLIILLMLVIFPAIPVIAGSR